MPRQADKIDRLASEVTGLKAKVYSHYGESVNQPVVAMPLKKKKPTAEAVEAAAEAESEAVVAGIDPSRLNGVEREMTDLRSIVRNLSAEISALQIKTTPSSKEALLGNK